MAIATHSLAIREDGTLWAWGVNSSGQLGDGTVTSPVKAPKKIGTATNWKLVVAGGSHNLAIRDDGTLWSWGSNSSGQAGDGTIVTPVLAPKKIGTATDWKQVVAGGNHNLAIKNDGSLWAWGQNNNGQIGDGTTTTPVTAPKKIGTGTDWKQVESGSHHALAIKNDGSLWGWGLNTNGQVGDGTITSPVKEPKRVGTDSDWKQVVAGAEYSLAIKDDGSLWGWGRNTLGQLGDGTITSPVTAPKKIGTDTDWKYVVAGADHTVALKKDGSLWAWGYNNHGQVGDGTITTPVTAPKKVGTDTDWKQVVAGYYHTLTTKNDGSLWAWGYNVQGQLGDGSTTSPVTSPKKIGVESTWKTLFSTGEVIWASITNNGSKFPKVKWSVDTGDPLTAVTSTRLLINGVEVFEEHNPTSEVTFTIDPEMHTLGATNTLTIEATTSAGDTVTKAFTVNQAIGAIPLLECDVRYNYENTDGEISEVVTWIEHDATCVPDDFEVSVVEY